MQSQNTVASSNAVSCQSPGTAEEHSDGWFALLLCDDSLAPEFIAGDELVFQPCSARQAKQGRPVAVRRGGVVIVEPFEKPIDGEIAGRLRRMVRYEAHALKARLAELQAV